MTTITFYIVYRLWPDAVLPLALGGWLGAWVADAPR